MALISAPFAYEAKIVPPRHRQPKPTRLQADAMLEIRELTESEAPVAIRKTDPKRPKAPVHEIRFHEDRLYRVLKGPHDQKLTAEEFAAVISGDRVANRHWPDYPFPRGLDDRDKRMPEHVFALPKAGDVAMREFHGSDQSAREAECARIGQNLAFIGGILHIECVEPTWQIAPGRWGAWVHFDTQPGKLDQESVWVRLDHPEVAQAICAELADTVENGWEPNSVEILIPEAIRFDEIVVNARNLIDAELPRLADPIGSLASVPAMRAWCDLREAADRWDRTSREGAHEIFRLTTEFLSHDLLSRETRHDLRGSVKTDLHDTYTREDPFRTQAAFYKVVTHDPALDDDRALAMAL